MGIKLFLIHHQQHRRFLAYLQNLTKRYPYLFVLDCSTLIVCLRVIIIFFLKKGFIYLFMRAMEREAETQAGGKQALCREPDVGLSPRTPGS